jgi:hypothetical protein
MEEDNSVPEPKPAPKRFLRKGLVDLIIAGAALFVSAISLWVGVRTESANEQMVSASTWPYLQIIVSNADSTTKLDLQFQVQNTGVGPAKVESFEVFWKKRPYRSAIELLKACCSYKVVEATSLDAKNHTPVLTGPVQGIVLRAGDTQTFIQYPLGPDNLDIWKRLDTNREQMSYRICYCSVLNQCYLNDLHSERYIGGQLHPKELSSCPVPAVSYTK